jgi:hypothetical protein
MQYLIVSTIPTLRLIYLTEQYAGVTEDKRNNNTTAAAELPTTRTRSSIHDEESRFPIHADDATTNASSNDKEPPAVGGVKMEHQEQSDDHEEEDDDYLDTLLQEAIDAVNQQVVPAHEEMALPSDEESENDSSTSSVHLDTVQEKFQDEMISSDEEIENDSSPSVHLDAIQQTSGNKRKRQAPIQSFDDRFIDLMAFKAKYGHCNVSQRGEDAPLGQWCSKLRLSYKKIQNNQKPRTKLSDEQIQRLNDAGFKWCLQKEGSAFDKRFIDLMAFKAKYGHCDVPRTGEDASLGKWCSKLRLSYKKIQNNQKPPIKLSEGQIQRLNDAGFKWCLRKAAGSAFDKRFIDLMAFKAKYGHCNVSTLGKDASLGKWCSELRRSYKKIQNNQKPANKLSDEQIQRLNDAGFKWCLKVRSAFDKRFVDLMAFKAKYGHCDVSRRGEDASLGQWCCKLRRSYTKKMQNNQKPANKLSDEQIQRLSDAGFKWCRFDERFVDLMAFKAKYGHCNVSRRGEDASLGRWCSELRRSYTKKMQNNQKPANKLSDEQIQRLSDAGFKWCR